MSTRTWNVKLMATEEYPETTLEGVSDVETKKILRELMYGSGLHDQASLRAAVLGADRHVGVGVDRHEGPLAA